MEPTRCTNDPTSGHGTPVNRYMAAESGSSERSSAARCPGLGIPGPSSTAPPEADSQASGSTPHVGLSGRSVGKQPSPFSVFNKPPQSTIPSLHNDTVQYYCSWIDSLRDKLPTLSHTSPISSEECGLNFKCRTSSWGNNEMALTFTSCDLRGNPSPVNDIGLQTLEVSPDHQPSDLELDERSVSMCHQLRTIFEHARSRQLGLQCDETIIENHILKLGALNVEANFSMKLQVNTQFPNGLPAPAGSVPSETLLFITTDSQKTSCRSGQKLEPLTEIVPLNAVNQKVTVHGRNIAGAPVEQFNISPPRIKRKTTGQQSLQPLATRPDYCLKVRLLVTPAVVFSVSRPCIMQGVANPSEEQLLQSCPGIEPFKQVTTTPLGNLRLLPSVIFNIVTPLPMIDILLASQSSEEFWLHREASLARALEARAAKKVRSCEQDNEP